MLTSVDFPAPLRPTSACVSPSVMTMPESRSAIVDPYLLEMCVASASGAVDVGCPLGANAESLMDEGAFREPVVALLHEGGAGGGALDRRRPKQRPCRGR